ncbi:MAG: PfkB family carbohydrate kinase [Chitinophagaceae bacterium]
MHKIVSFGEVMMKLSPPGKLKISQAQNLDILFSGSEANVSAALSKWGLAGVHVTRFPENELGKSAISWLLHRGMDTRYIQLGGDRLGLYFVEQGAMSRPTSITYDRLPSAFSTINKGMFNWKEILEGANWFHWSGITPAISSGAADVLMEALTECAARGIMVSGDINFRSGLWKYGKTPGEIMAPLVALTQVIVASENDTHNIFGITAEKDSANAYISICNQMKKRFPANRFYITSPREQLSASHNRLSGWLWNGDDFLETRNYNMEQIVERIGSGDAFMAGFIYAALQGWNDQQKIDFATASAVLKHSIEGDIMLSTIEQVLQVMNGETGGRIVR